MTELIKAHLISWLSERTCLALKGSRIIWIMKLSISWHLGWNMEATAVAFCTYKIHMNAWILGYITPVVWFLELHTMKPDIAPHYRTLITTFTERLICLIDINFHVWKWLQDFEIGVLESGIYVYIRLPQIWLLNDLTKSYSSRRQYQPKFWFYFF